MKLIDKDALVAEIEKIIPSEPFPRTSETLYGAEKYGKRAMCFKILDFINTLEVKEVDFDAEYAKYFENKGLLATVNIKHLARHFFELGLRINNEKEK